MSLRTRLPMNRVLSIALVTCSQLVAGCNSRLPVSDNRAQIYGPSPWEKVPLHFHKGDEVPPQVRQDLDELNARLGAYMANRPQKNLRLSISSDERALAVWMASSWWSDEEPPTSVWLWPDWQNAEQVVVFDGFSRLEFVTDTFVELRQNNRAAYCDIHEPQTLFEAQSPRFTDLFLTSDKHWFGLREGQVLRGRLDSPDSLTRGQELRLSDHISHLGVAYDGAVLVVQTSTQRVRSYKTDTMQMIQELHGGMWGSGLPLRGDRPGTFISTSERIYWIDVLPDGTFQAVPFEYGHRPNAERPAGYSRCGQWVMTYRDGWAPGLIHTHWRAMPGIKPTTAMPPI